MSWADETADDFFARLEFPGLDLLPGIPRGIKVGETLEVCGEPSTGKTALLMECIVRCVLPVDVGGVRVGGAGCRAVFVDTEGGFDALRLAETLRTRLMASGVLPDCAAEEAAAALARLRVMRCPTSSELCLGLCALRLELDAPPPIAAAAMHGALLPPPPASPSPASAVPPPPPSPPPPPRLLLIDSVSTFQWMERAESRAAARRGGGGSHGDASSHDASAEAGLDSKLSTLVSLLRRQRLSIIWSRSPLLSHNGGYEFPILDQRSAVAAAHELNHPTMRLRLRRHAEPAATLAHATASTPAAGTLQLAFQAMLDTAAPAVGSSTSEPPLRREMLLYAVGVRAA